MNSDRDQAFGNERDQDDNVSLEEWDNPIDGETGEPGDLDDLLFEDQEEGFEELNFDPALHEVERDYPFQEEVE